MAYDYRCPICGAYLDPGERCDCETERVNDDTDCGIKRLNAQEKSYAIAEQMSLL